MCASFSSSFPFFSFWAPLAQVLLPPIPAQLPEALIPEPANSPGPTKDDFP